MRFNKLMTSSMCAAILLLTCSFTIQARPGDLDPTYGNGGIALTPNQGVIVNNAVLQNGKTLVAGGIIYNSPNGQYAPFLARYNSDGTLDTTFGTGGIVTTRFSLPNGGSESGYFATVVLQPDGKIVAAGYNYVPTNAQFDDPIMARYNADGSLDTTFGDGGKVFTRTGTGPSASINGQARIYALVIAPDSSI
jgi:uncharacterized delta-60 repeat protein